MSFSERLAKFKSNEKVQNVKYSVTNALLEHKPIIDMALSFSRSISHFAESKSPLSFVEGGISTISSLSGIFGEYSDDYFAHKNGWSLLVMGANQAAIYDILNSVLPGFPSKSLKFSGEAECSMIYTLPFAKIARSRKCLFFRHEETSKEMAIEVLIKEKINTIKSNFFSISESLTPSVTGHGLTYKYDLKGEDLICLHSETALNEAMELKSFLEKGINRSIIFNGLAGTGKSSMAQSIINQLNLRTLKFHYRAGIDLATIIFIIQTFNIEALILDDLSHSNDTPNLLYFLEWAHRHVKLTIATTNSLKPFTPALLRPGRFDVIKQVDRLDERVVMNVLGDELYEQIGKRVNKWPVAFLVELKNRISIISNLNLEDSIKELEERVTTQIKHSKGE